MKCKLNFDEALKAVSHELIIPSGRSVA